jgi:LasA protease
MKHRSPVLKAPIRTLLFAGCILLVISACVPAPRTIPTAKPSPSFLASATRIASTPVPTRASYNPGTLVEYLAQSGDTLPALAAHFNSTVQEIRSANPILPQDVTTLPPGLPMKMPIYYQSLWGSSYKIIPDQEFIFGPSQKKFNTVSFVNSQPGWLKNYEEFVGGRQRKGGELIDYLSTNFSISPRVLLAIAQYQTSALTQNEFDPNNVYPLGIIDINRKGIYWQLHRAVNILSLAYYGWRTGTLKTIDHKDGTIEKPDPWLNSATTALHVYYAQILSGEEYEKAIHSDGFILTYQQLFGDPWENTSDHIPGMLQQPNLVLPFAPGKAWTYTGGPHAAWGENTDLTAVDFAPPLPIGGCTNTAEYSVAMADGKVVRSDNGVVILDLDGDGDEKTGWAILYLHVANEDRVKLGTQLRRGDLIGHPSCEGGTATGTHIHIARKYNGEWIAADGPIEFIMEGWRVKNGNVPYQGELVRFSTVVRASPFSAKTSEIFSGKLE